MTYYIATDGVTVDPNEITFTDLYRAMAYAETECHDLPWAIYTDPTDGAAVASFDDI